MLINVAINGYGRIGKCLLRAIYENKLTNIFNVIAINDLGTIQANAYLTKYDTTHGLFDESIIVKDQEMFINGNRIKMLSEKSPSKLPWKQLDIDLVFECTGAIKSKEQYYCHLQAGAKRVMLSMPGDLSAEKIIVFGINHKELNSKINVISAASCTTQCASPVAKIINDALKIKTAFVTTIHSYSIMYM